MQFKRFSGIELKSDAPGAFRATIATLNVVDHDGDVTVPGAFKQGQEVIISAYQHGSWEGALPVGKGIIGANALRAWVDGKFFLSTSAGNETYATVKALGRLVEWSYGFDPIGVSYDPSELAQYPGARRILIELDVFEASPVLKGAGIGTGTESIKGSRVAQRVSDESLKAIAERLNTEMLATEFERISAKIGALDCANEGPNDQKDFAEVAGSFVNPELVSVARTAMMAACKSLGLSQWPRLRWFSEQTAEEKAYRTEYGDDDIVSFKGRAEIGGQTWHSTNEIWIRADLAPSQVAEMVAHELVHISKRYLSGPAIENEATAFGRQYRALTFND